MNKDISLKILYGMFICSLIIVMHHSISNQFYSVTGIMTYLVRFIHYGIFSFCMPFFFFWSGFFSTRQFVEYKYKGLIKRKIKSTLIPYISWNTTWTIFAVVLFLLPLTRGFNQAIVWDGTMESIIQGIFAYKYNGQYWYMLNLLIFAVATPAILRVAKNKYLLVAFFVGCIALSNYDFSFFSFSGLATFMMGSEYFYKNENSLFGGLSIKLKRLPSIACLLLLLFVCIITSLFKINNVYRMLSMLSLLLFWRALDDCANISVRFEDTNILENHFFLYSFHETPQLVINKLFYIIIPIYGFIGLTLNFVVGVTLTFVSAYFINQSIFKYFPHVYIVFNGNRKKHLEKG